MIDFNRVPSPCYVIDERRLKNNLDIIERVQQEAGVEIILAFKGFATWGVFPIIRNKLAGATASSLYEARLCNEEIKKKAHTYAVAYQKDEFDEIAELSSHITFNSLNQFHQFSDKIPADLQVGIRVNPEWSDVETDLYNPASPSSRLGMTAGSIEELPKRINGLHFHVLCESSAESLVRVLENLENRFEGLLKKVDWVNMGGGHLMTRKGYNLELLISTLKDFKKKHNVDIVLEPGSAIAWQTGDLKSTVLDIVENNGVKTAIANISFTCHMPDCLEMPYKPVITGASLNTDDKPYQYRIGGVSCLAGDYMEAFGFDNQLKVGDTLIFEDMIHYTMVKTTMFNGVKHPSIGIWQEETGFKLIREFEYEDYKRRLS